MTQYTWIVTRDSILGDSSDAVGRIGPPGAKNRERFDRVIIEGEHFRLLSASRDVQFSGYIMGEFSGSEPLEDYGADNGCAMIEFELDGSWVSLETFLARRTPAT